MNLKKLASVAMMAAFALGAFGAKAAIGTVTNYSKLTVSITVTTNGTGVTKGHVTRYPVGSAKFTDKTLLALFATANWANTTFPAGAQLVIGWESPWDGAVLVVDKTGTNVLYNASDETTSAGGDEIFQIYTEYDGDYTETYDDAGDAAPGYDTWNESYAYYVELYDGLAPAGITDIYSEYSSGKQQFTQRWGSADFNYTTWSDSESIDLQMGGGQEFEGNSDGSVSGSINFAGHGVGENSWLY
jgi:hypothetical protein